MRRLAILGLVASCGFRIDGAVSGDADVTSDAADAGDADTPIYPCEAPPTWADGRVPSSTLHVDPTATGAQDGSQASPFRTLGQAVAVATPGTQILLAAGTYDPETLTDVHGTAAAPIWIEGPASLPRATFTGSTSLHFIKPQYLVLRHLAFTSFTSSAVNLDDGGDRSSSVAHHVVISDVHVNSAAATAFQFTGLTDVAIYDSSATDISRGVQMIGVQRATVARVTVTRASFAAIHTAGGSSDVEVRQSRFVGSTGRVFWIGGSSTETEFRPPLAATSNAEASNIRILNNLIHDGRAVFTCSVCTGVLVAGNYVHGDQFTHIFRFVQEHGTINGKPFVIAGALRAIDNATEISGTAVGVRMESGTDCSACVFDHNLWLRVDDPTDSTPVFPVPETNGIYGVPSGYTPQGELCSGGAAIGAGVVVPGVDGTIEGVCRPTPPSIGPNEPDGSC
jgi:hypothetical protein